MKPRLRSLPYRALFVCGATLPAAETAQEGPAKTSLPSTTDIVVTGQRIAGSAISATDPTATLEGRDPVARGCRP